MILQFVNLGCFVSERGEVLTKDSFDQKFTTKYPVLQFEIPPQLDLSTKEAIKKATDNTGTVFKSVVASNFFLMLLKAGSMQ